MNPNWIVANCFPFHNFTIGIETLGGTGNFCQTHTIVWWVPNASRQNRLQRKINGKTGVSCFSPAFSSNETDKWMLYEKFPRRESTHVLRHEWETKRKKNQSSFKFNCAVAGSLKRLLTKKKMNPSIVEIVFCFQSSEYRSMRIKN